MSCPVNFGVGGPHYCQVDAGCLSIAFFRCLFPLLFRSFSSCLSPALPMPFHCRITFFKLSFHCCQVDAAMSAAVSLPFRLPFRLPFYGISTVFPLPFTVFPLPVHRCFAALLRPFPCLSSVPPLHFPCLSTACHTGWQQECEGRRHSLGRSAREGAIRWAGRQQECTERRLSL